MLTRRSVMALATAPLFVKQADADVLSRVVDAKPFAQTKTNSCWVAAAVILLRWKHGVDVSESDVAKQAGPVYATAFDNNKALKGEQIEEFAQKLGLRVEAPQNFTVKGYFDLLRAKGPLWVGSRLDADTPQDRGHARILRGVVGDGSFNKTSAWVLDPDRGRDYQESMLKFAKELEDMAKLEVKAGVPLFPQVIHLP